MKRVIKIISLTIIFALCIVLFKEFYYKDFSVTIKSENIKSSLRFRGLKDAVDFVLDEKGNYYIAYSNRIQFINPEGKSYNIFNDKNINITSLEYKNEKLYFASKCSVFSYDLHKKEFKEIIKDLPNFGDYNKSLLKINGDYLYVTIGSATNSGIVGPDNQWTKDNPFSHDISPYKTTLKGINFDEGKTGAFVGYGTKNIEGQIIPGHYPGNASIIMHNIESGASATFAWGIRNVKGLDFDSRGRMIATIGGMENRGLRPVKGDTDYIYVIKAKTWYGWPDYSGGDPINSPKFKDNNNKTISFILDNHPTTNPSAPLYIHKALDSIQSLAVDQKGDFEELDTIYFYDDKDKMIYSLNNKGILSEKIKFNNNSKITSIKYSKNQILILDSENGNMYTLESIKMLSDNFMNKPIIYFAIITILIVIITLLKTIIDINNKRKEK